MFEILSPNKDSRAFHGFWGGYWSPRHALSLVEWGVLDHYVMVMSGRTIWTRHASQKSVAATNRCNGEFFSASVIPAFRSVCGLVGEECWSRASGMGRHCEPIPLVSVERIFWNSEVTTSIVGKRGSADTIPNTPWVPTPRSAHT